MARRIPGDRCSKQPCTRRSAQGCIPPLSSIPAQRLRACRCCAVIHQTRSTTDGGIDERRRTTSATRAGEARLARGMQACQLVSSASRSRPVRATPLWGSIESADSKHAEVEHVRAYAFEPSSPCSSPANATSSTLVWNLRRSSLIRRAIASNETTPEPSSLPPGAYNTTGLPDDYSRE